MQQLCAVAQECGGCPQLGAASEVQRRQKLDRVRTLLAASLGQGPMTFCPVQSELDYRNRIRLRVTEAGTFSFFNPVKERGCAVLRSDLRDGLAELREAFDTRRELLLPFSHAELRAPDLDGRPGLLLNVHTEQDWGQERAHAWFDRATGIVPARFLLDVKWAASSGGDSQQLARTWSEGRAAQRWPLGGDIYQRVPLDGFMQVNSTINAALVARVVQTARELQVRRVLDLYCGSGNFLLPLAAANIETTGVEIVASSISAARRAAEEQGLEASLHQAVAHDFLAMRTAELRLDLVVVDPPRAGLGDALDPLVALGVEHVIVCSCNPRSLAADLARLIARGYELTSVELFDMFAHTDHVEALATLRRA